MADDMAYASSDRNITDTCYAAVDIPDISADSTPQVDLVCPNHQTTVLDGIMSMFREQYKTDLKLTGAGGEIVQAHQFMLALFSPAFRPCFASNSDKEIDLQRLSSLQPLLQFVYSGRVVVPQTSLTALLKSARRLGVDLLVRAIEDSLATLASTTTTTTDSTTVEDDEITAPLSATAPTSHPAQAIRHSRRLSGRVKRPLATARRGRARRKLVRPQSPPSLYLPLIRATESESEEPVDEIVATDEPRLHSPKDVQAETEPTATEPDTSRDDGRADGVSTASLDTQLRCSHCEYSTPSGKRRNLCLHLAHAHKMDEAGQPLREKFACSECSATFFFGRELHLHALKMHASHKPFRCQECDYATVHKGSLRIHVNIVHRNIRQYVCDQCGHRSAHLSAYKCHARTHTGEKPYRCDECDKAFSDRYNYKLHVQKHVSDEKSFLCHLCSHATRRRDNLRSHLARVHKSELPVTN